MSAAKMSVAETQAESILRLIRSDKSKASKSKASNASGSKNISPYSAQARSTTSKKSQAKSTSNLMRHPEQEYRRVFLSLHPRICAMIFIRWFNENGMLNFQVPVYEYARERRDQARFFSQC